MAKVLEVCVDSLESVRQAVAGGADRLELCTGLAVGGLTPYMSFMEQVREESSAPVRCLVRHRAGDFLYNRDDVDLLQRQIRKLKKAGADGFVIGCLTPEGNLNKEAMKVLIEAADGKKLTLHRCIDVSRDPVQTYLDAAELGIDTVLTSGGAVNCWKGREIIRRLIALREEIHGPEVLIGAGVNGDVIEQFRQEVPGARAFHMSGKVEIPSGMVFRREGVPMGLPGLDEFHIQQTSSLAVRKARLVMDLI